jgi:2,5-diamino-6-(ribosylamino)-4(3H)-pyrimidinone 5'-phosphate reductase
VDRITIQTGGTMNASWIQEGLIDRVLLVVAPAMVGGKDTASLMDGEPMHRPEELVNIKALELVQARPSEHSYVLLEYRVNNRMMFRPRVR